MTTTHLAITADDVRDAARLIEGQVMRTPCAPSRVLSKLTGAEIWIKFENFQFTASFKERGAVNKLARLTEAERQAGVAAMSAGNHAQAVAAHALRPDLHVIGVESAGYCSAYAAIKEDPSLVRGGPTIAEGIAVKGIGKQTLPLIRAHAHELVRVEESAIERAVGLLANV